MSFNKPKVVVPGVGVPEKAYPVPANARKRIEKKRQPVEVASTGTTRRIDSEGRDVTDLPGLWSESDKIENL